MSIDYFDYQPSKKLDLRKILPRFETVKEVARRSHRLRRTLEKGNQEQVQLARALALCGPDARCGVALCPKCRRRYRMWRTAKMLQLFSGHKIVCFLTLIPPDLRYASGALDQFDPRALVERVKRQIKRAGLEVIAVGEVDFSYEVDGRSNRKRARPSMWQPHLHMIVTGCSELDLRAALEPHYPPTRDVGRPLLIKKVKDRAEAFSYCTKPFVSARVRYRDRDGNQRKRSVALKRSELREIALFTAKQRQCDLQLLIGVRQHGFELRLFSTKAKRNVKIPSKRPRIDSTMPTFA